MRRKLLKSAAVAALALTMSAASIGPSNTGQSLFAALCAEGQGGSQWQVRLASMLSITDARCSTRPISASATV